MLVKLGVTVKTRSIQSAKGTLHPVLGSPDDWAEARLDPEFVARVRAMRAAFAVAPTTVAARYRVDDGPALTLHFEPATLPVEPDRVLGVSREAFWWSGYVDGAGSIPWETDRVPWQVLDEHAEPSGEVDLRRVRAAFR